MGACPHPRDSELGTRSELFSGDYNCHGSANIFRKPTADFIRTRGIQFEVLIALKLEFSPSNRIGREAGKKSERCLNKIQIEAAVVERLIISVWLLLYVFRREIYFRVRSRDLDHNIYSSSKVHYEDTFEKIK